MVEDVRTNVQSGHWVFRAGGAASAVAREAAQRDRCRDDARPADAIRTAAQLAKVVEQCPFDDRQRPRDVLVEGASAAAAKIEQEKSHRSADHVRGRGSTCASRIGLGRSKLAAALNKGAAAADGTTQLAHRHDTAGDGAGLFHGV